MNKSKKICLVLMGTVLLYNCSEEQPVKENHSIENYELSGHGIDVETSERLFANFNNNRGADQTQSNWIGLKDLKNYIAFLETVAEKNKQPISGIHLYFGKYSNDKNIKADNKNRTVPRFGNYENRETVFFNPTYRDESVRGKPEMLKHKAFYIVPADDSENGDKYIGTYTELEYDSKLEDTVSQQQMLLLKVKRRRGRTSLNYDELNAVPPRL